MMHNDLDTLSDAELLRTQRKLLLIRWACAVGIMGLPLGLFWALRTLELGIGISAGIAGITLVTLVIPCIRLTRTLKALEVEVSARGL